MHTNEGHDEAVAAFKAAREKLENLKPGSGLTEASRLNRDQIMAAMEEYLDLAITANELYQDIQASAKAGACTICQEAYKESENIRRVREAVSAFADTIQFTREIH